MPDQYLWFGGSLALAGCCGWLLGNKLKIPVGRLIGAMLAVAVCSVHTGFSWYPPWLFFLVKVFAGLYIGISFRREDAAILGRLLLPFLIVMLSLLLLNLLTAWLIIRYNGVQPLTALFATAPGAITEMSLLAHDYNADVSFVSTMQLLRVVGLLTIFPQLTRWASRRYHQRHGQPAPLSAPGRAASAVPARRYHWLSLLIALGGGLLGQYSGLSGGALIGSAIASACWSLLGRKAFFPPKGRWPVQICAGLIIGSNFSPESISVLSSIAPAAGVMLAGYLLLWPLLSYLVARLARTDMETAMLAACPAGATDMALIANELGGNAAQVASIHILRMICVISVFPSLYQAVVRLF